MIRKMMGRERTCCQETEDQAETRSMKKAMTFVSLAETLKVDWSTELYAKRILLRSSSPSSPRLVTHPAQREADLAKLKEIRDQTLIKLSVPTSKIVDKMLG